MNSPDTTPETSVPVETARGRFNLATIIETIGPIIGLLVIVILFSALQREKFLTPDNAQVILLQTAVVAMAALGMTLIIASGGIDLSVGSAIALSTVVIAQLLSRNLPPLVAGLGGVLTGSACGLLIGLLVTRFKLTPFIVTLGLWGALRGVAKGLANEQTVSAPETGLNKLLQTLGDSQKWMIFPPGVWLTLLCAIFVALLLKYTRFGRHIFAIGSNEATARLCGIPVENTKLAIYAFAGAFTGLAGVLQFSYLTIGDPTTAEGRELDVIAAVVIGGASLTGGQGSVLGTIVGALIMTTVANGCTKLGLANWVQQIVTGGIIIFAVTLDQLRQRRK
jgi:ribose transport system permease protein